MQKNLQNQSLLYEYLQLDRKTVIQFGCLIFGVIVVVICVYSAFRGFDNLITNMQKTGSMMVINAQAPVQTQIPEPDVMPNTNAFPLGSAAGSTGIRVCPYCGETLPAFQPQR